MSWALSVYVPKLGTTPLALELIYDAWALSISTSLALNLRSYRNFRLFFFRQASVNVSKGTIAGSTTVRTRSKRSARTQDRSTSKVISSSGTPVTHRAQAPDFNSADGGEQVTMTTVRDRVSAMQEMFGAQLEFLITEFTKLEQQLLRVPEAGSNSVSKLSKL